MISEVSGHGQLAPKRKYHGRRAHQRKAVSLTAARKQREHERATQEEL